MVPIRQMDRENRWLSEMAKARWMLQRVSGISYTFASCEPRELVFFHELRGVYGKTSKQLVEDLEKTGWNHVASSTAYDCFASLSTNKPLEIERDLTAVKKRIAMLLFLNAVAIANLSVILMMSSRGFFQDFAPFRTGFLVIVLILLPFLLYSTIRLIGMVRKIRRSIKE